MRFPAVSQIPIEIWHEIAAHNADDRPSLFAMALVSTALHFSAIEQLFSSVCFSCDQDISWWNTMVERTPRLQTIVRTVTFSGYPRSGWAQSPKRLREAVVPPQILPMPNVRIVQWNASSIDISMAVQHLALFPNMKELHLSNMKFNSFDDIARLLGACGPLRVLSFRDTDRVEDSDSDSDFEIPRAVQPANTPWTLDLTAIEELTFIDCGPEDVFLFGLMENSWPARLKSLTFDGEYRCSGPEMEKFLRLVAPSLVNLAVYSHPERDEELQVVEMFKRLPAFPALNTLSLSLDAGSHAEAAITVLGSAPLLSTIILQIPLLNEDEEDDREYFREIIGSAFPWRKRESMKCAVTKKFPLIRRIVFHFRVPDNSPIHFRRGLRRWMERQLSERLEETREDLTEYLKVGWFDYDLNPVEYSKTTGKPQWKLRNLPEPDTESSEYESESWDDDGSENYDDW
ncbi:hypothetical protein C8F04DRAFT_1228546 [Mycena alexandri]|uniref:Uncharacterized protein n=1 Tax=Mycena alexandri TaxID=1745969 RepID=A0AAD6XEB2_9AGAR|nr:hypothetical protein C8F04DRAFT_1228546 [Mycena alexandri]